MTMRAWVGPQEHERVEALRYDDEVRAREQKAAD